jgi:CTP:molybdopterin cytidylyltransferase MocA
LNNATGPVLVLLAAGAGSRFGATKQLTPLQGEPMLRRAARIALGSGRPLLVLGGAQAESVEPSLQGLPLHWHVHRGWADGLGSSIACAITFVQHEWPHASGALLMLADQPQVDLTLLQSLLKMHMDHPADIVAADYGPRRGPPVLFPRGCFAALTALQGDRGAQALLLDPPRPLHSVPAPQAAFDIDRPQDYQQAKQQLEQSD